MVGKFAVAIVMSLASMVVMRHLSQKQQRARVRSKNPDAKVNKVETLVWDEKTKTYRPGN